MASAARALSSSSTTRRNSICPITKQKERCHCLGVAMRWSKRVCLDFLCLAPPCFDLPCVARMTCRDGVHVCLRQIVNGSFKRPRGQVGTFSHFMSNSSLDKLETSLMEPVHLCTERAMYGMQHTKKTYTQFGCSILLGLSHRHQAAPTSWFEAERGIGTNARIALKSQQMSQNALCLCLAQEFYAPL